MGNSVYIDPTKQLFPFSQFFTPIESMLGVGNDINNKAKDVLRDYASQGVISRKEMERIINSQSGPLWDQALAEAQTQLKDNQLDAMNLASMVMTPAMWWTYPYHILKGTPEKLYPLPGTRVGQSLRSLSDGDGVLGFIGNILATPEESLRKKFNLNAYGEWGEYYIDRMLSNLAAEGTISTDQALMAMMERKGEIYDLAISRVEEENVLKQPGGKTATAIKNGNFGAISMSLLSDLFPAKILPEGEIKQRGLKDVYYEAWDRYNNGEVNALNEFYEEYPEYKARLALFDEPETRLREFLVDGIWEKWMEIDDMNKTLIAEQLGQKFETTFLDKQTRDYTAVDIETLAYWSRMLGGTVPETELTGDVTNLPMYQQQELKQYKPEVLAQVRQFQSSRDAEYPNYKFLQDTYFLIPEDQKDVRKEFLKQYPELENYWDWKDAYYEQYPEVAKWADEQKKRYENNEDIYTTMPEPPKMSEQDAENFMATVFIDSLGSVETMQFIFALYSGGSVEGGLRMALKDKWKDAGEPGDSFDDWVNLLMKQLLD
jgi:hypothetical protein